VRVTHVGNGKSVVVRVTDRGPFHADRIIDLSYAAAYRLGYINNGSSLVEIETLLPSDSTPLPYTLVKAAPVAQPAPPVVSGSERDEIESLAEKLAARESLPTAASPRAEATTPSGIFLQLGAFSSADNAENLRVHLSRELDWLNEGIQINAGGGMHRVHLGPYPNRNEAEKVAEKIRVSLGYKPTLISR
jgi:rare lipoprotein A